MHIRYLSRRIMGRIKKNGSEKEQKSAAVTVIMFCAAASAAVFFRSRVFDGDFLLIRRKHRSFRSETGYLKTEGACYCGIGILFLLYGYFRAVERPKVSLSSYDPLTWNTGCPCLCMCAVVRRWSDLDGDTDRLGDGGCGRNHPVKTRRAY